MKKCTKLKVLNLHNNGIHHVESLLALSVIPNLIALTLYNCPIYKRSGYRHHTVNTMWSIKVRDPFHPTRIKKSLNMRSRAQFYFRSSFHMSHMTRETHPSHISVDQNAPCTFILTRRGQLDNKIKALDHYILSDEEIIEGVTFGKSKYHAFRNV